VRVKYYSIDVYDMRQTRECPLCGGHGLLRVDMGQRWWWQKLRVISWVCRVWRRVTGATEP